MFFCGKCGKKYETQVAQFVQLPVYRANYTVILNIAKRMQITGHRGRPNIRYAKNPHLKKFRTIEGDPSTPFHSAQDDK